MTFEYLGNTTSFYALIDSGADFSISFKEFGLALGIKFDEDASEEIEGVTTSLKAYEHLYLNVFWLDRKFDEGRDFPFIIGRQPFFDKFDVIFRQSKKKFYLEPV